MTETKSNKYVRVYDKEGRPLSNCTRHRAKQLISRGAAVSMGRNTIQLALTREERQQIRLEALERDNYICYICGCLVTRETATADHIKSRVKGGSDFLDNLACCCRECNSDKGSMDLEDYLILRQQRGGG